MIMPALKIFVDDLRNPPDDTWIVARTVTEAIRILATMPVGEISLDHDISHQVSLDGNSRPYHCSEDFTAVAYFLGERYPTYSSAKQPPKITIHSANSIGAERIQNILTSYGLSATYVQGKPVNRLEMEI